MFTGTEIFTIVWLVLAVMYFFFPIEINGSKEKPFVSALVGPPVTVLLVCAGILVFLATLPAILVGATVVRRKNP